MKHLSRGDALPNITYRFVTNAPNGSSRTYAELLGQSLGLTITPNVLSAVPAAGLAEVALGGTNFAEGGARISEPVGIGFNQAGGITTVPLGTQVDRLLAANPTSGANDLVVMWGSANDAFAHAGAVGAALITPAQAATETFGLGGAAQGSRCSEGHRGDCTLYRRLALQPVARRGRRRPSDGPCQRVQQPAHRCNRQQRSDR